MRFGLFTILSGTTWSDVLAQWQHADRTGWDVACLTDHFMPNTADRAGDTLECWTALAALAARIPRMRMGTIVSGNTYRHPAVVAKMAANIDIISGGRLVCGMGAAWQENEHRAYGIPFHTVADRLAMLDEACQVLKMLWTQERSEFKGRFYQLEDAPLMPKPVQRPHPELMIGGGGEKVTLAIAARHADHWNVWGGPETLAHKGRILDAHCAAAGRDPKHVLRSANMPIAISDSRAEVERLEQALTRRFGMEPARAKDTLLGGSPEAIRNKLGRLRDAGVGLLFVPTMLSSGDAQAQRDRFMTEIAPAFR